MSATAVFLDDSSDLQRLMTLLLRNKLGIECLCFAHVQDLVSEAPKVLSRDIAILDINLGPDEPSGLDAYYWLKEQGFQGKVVFLTGHAKSNPLVMQALQNGVDVLEKPLRSDKLVSAIERLEART